MPAVTVTTNRGRQIKMQLANGELLQNAVTARELALLKSDAVGGTAYDVNTTTVFTEIAGTGGYVAANINSAYATDANAQTVIASQTWTATGADMESFDTVAEIWTVNSVRTVMSLFASAQARTITNGSSYETGAVTTNANDA